MKDIAKRYGWKTLMIRQRIQLAFLSPAIVGAVMSDKLEPVSVFRGRAGLRQREARAIREVRRHAMI